VAEASRPGWENAPVLDVFGQVVAPVFVVALVGLLVGARYDLDVRPLVVLTFRVLMPALVYQALVDLSLDRGLVLRVGAVALIVHLTTLALALGWGRVRRLDRRSAAAVGLASMMANSGNLGLPVALLAFGDRGLELAVVNMVVGATLYATVGTVVASGSAGSVGASLRAPLRTPMLWALLAALIVNWRGWVLPVVVATPVRSISTAAIPVALMVLGLQLRGVRLGEGWSEVTAAGVIRLLLGPLIAWGAAGLLGLGPMASDVLIVVSAMPTAVSATIWAAEFDDRPELVSTAVLGTSVASLLSLTALLAVLT